MKTLQHTVLLEKRQSPIPTAWPSHSNHPSATPPTTRVFLSFWKEVSVEEGRSLYVQQVYGETFPCRRCVKRLRRDFIRIFVTSSSHRHIRHVTTGAQRKNKQKTPPLTYVRYNSSPGALLPAVQTSQIQQWVLLCHCTCWSSCHYNPALVMTLALLQLQIKLNHVTHFVKLILPCEQKSPHGSTCARRDLLPIVLFVTWVAIQTYSCRQC